MTGATLNGGGGADTIDYSAASSGLIIDLGAQLVSDGIRNDVLISIENAVGTAYDDLIKANAVTGATLNGGGGADTIDYSAASSGLIIDLGAQLVSDGIRNDVLISIENAVGTAYDELIKANAVTGATLNGGGGADTIDYSGCLVRPDH